MANGNGEHVQFTEAPASINLSFDYQGYSGIQLTLRAESGQEVLTKLQGALSALGKMGAQPTQPRTFTKVETPTGNGGAPTCQYHGPMKRSKKFEGWFCSAKMGDGSYCKEKVTD